MKVTLYLDNLKALREVARERGTLDQWGDLMLEWAQNAIEAGNALAAREALAARVLAEADRLLYEWTPQVPTAARPDLAEVREYVMTRIDKALEGRDRHPASMPGPNSWADSN